MRLAVVASHPIQYHAPLFRELARRLDLTVFFAHRGTPTDQSKAGFGVEFAWDSDLLGGYEHVFLANVAIPPGIDRFGGCDTPDIATLLANGRFDAVVVCGWHLKAYVQAIFAAKRLRLPLLARGDSQLKTPRSALTTIAKSVIYPNFLRLFDAALYVGERSHAYWRHYHYPERRLFFSPHCIDIEWFATRATASAAGGLRDKLAIDRAGKVALFAGKLVPFKRPLDLVDAAGILRQSGSDIAIVVAGAGELSDELSARAARLKVPLHHLGFCNQSEMPPAYAAADVLVLPSDGHETWGLVANEALACGCPVVLSDAVGAGPDLVDDDRTGRIFPATHIAALAKALREVLSSPPAPQALAAKSHAYSPAAAAGGIEAALAMLRPSRVVRVEARPEARIGP